MKKIEQHRVLERLKIAAFNSSHFVWVISDFHFYESTTGWIFAVARNFGTNLLALDPLPPVELAGTNFDWNLCAPALKELESFLPNVLLHLLQLEKNLRHF